MNSEIGKKLQKKSKSVPVFNIDIYEEIMYICIHSSLQQL
jgi:hypothetical protein